jgi:hypothetical protein
MRGENWWSMSVFPVGENYFPPPPEKLSTKQLEKSARAGSEKFSFLKVSIEYSFNGVKPRCLVLDVGAGLDIFLPPSSMVQARLLVPDPASIPEVLPINLVDAEFASLVAITAQCVAAPVGRRMGTYTTCYFLTSENPDQGEVLDPFQCAAKRVSVSSDGDLTDGLSFGWKRGDIPDVLNMGSANAPTTRPKNVPPTDIPGTSNVLHYVPPAIPVGGQIVCVVQELEI